LNGRARLSSSISAVPIMRGAACAGMDTVVAFIDCANLRKCAICDLSPIQGYGMWWNPAKAVGSKTVGSAQTISSSNVSLQQEPRLMQ